ncbi:smad nuclear-interacting protein 1, partial [Sigmodon hispidus]
MKVGKREQERSGHRRYRTEDALETVVVKQEPLSPEPVAHLWPEAPASSPSPPPTAVEQGQASYHGNQAGERAMKQEPEDHPRRGREDQKHQEPLEQEQRRAPNSEGDRDLHLGRSHQRRRSGERPGSGQGRDPDSQNLQAQQEERGFHNARHPEHHQQNESAEDKAQEVIPCPARNRSKEELVKEKPSFELSGALLKDTNTFRGVVIKYSEPPEARIPKKRWRLYPFKNDEMLPQHAVFQYRLVEHTRADGTVGHRVKPSIIDLGSGNGTFLNNKCIEPQRYYELKEKDVLKFGF